VIERTKEKIEVCAAAELPSGEMRLIDAPDGAKVGVFNCAGTLYAIEDRCSHDDGPLCEGDWDAEACMVVCPRHGSRFDLESGIPMSLPAFQAVPTYPVSVREDGVVVVEVPD
jgi:3-phenylpropionate/trans-cinnamate dioxygenase ferredoxin subunit